MTGMTARISHEAVSIMVLRLSLVKWYPLCTSGAAVMILSIVFSFLLLVEIFDSRIVKRFQ